MIGGKLNKVWLLEDKDMLVQLHLPNKGKTYLRIKSPNFVYLTDYKQEMPERPHGFCLFLRKYLDNARIREISQVGFERVLKIVFEKKEGLLNFYIMLFAPGNFILTDENNKIMSALELQKYKDREIKKGELFVPPAFKYNFIELTESELKELINASDKENIVKTLAIELGLGGLYAEELLLKAGIDKNKKTLAPKEITHLFKEIKELRKLDIKPFIINGKEIVPFDLLSFKDVNDENKQPCSTYNEALDKVLTERSLVQKQEQVQKESNKNLSKEERIIEKQELQVNELKAQADQNQKIGEAIYKNYQVVDEILKEINLAKKKFSWKEIKDKLKSHKIIKQINEKQQEVVIELEDK